MSIERPPEGDAKHALDGLSLALVPETDDLSADASRTVLEAVAAAAAHERVKIAHLRLVTGAPLAMAPPWTLERETALPGHGAARLYSGGQFSLATSPAGAGRALVVAAARALATHGQKATQAALEAALRAIAGPAPDLILVLGGGTTLRRAFTFEAAYAELGFLKETAAGLTPALLRAALDDFSSRDRRFGGTRKAEAK